MSANKRVRQTKMTTQALLDFDLGESSSDSDFRISDEEQVSDDCSDTSKENSDSDDDNSSDDNDKKNADSDNDSEDSVRGLKQLLANDNNSKSATTATTSSTTTTTTTTTTSAIATTKTATGENIDGKSEKLDDKLKALLEMPIKPICCICLGDRSDGANEIVECDGCAVSVHEGCYGVNDVDSLSSTNSTHSTTPWFCEACRVGVFEPPCELCPNRGGIYKETDVGKWVHLLCALYIPGVAFGDVEGLAQVTLFEMPYNKWGAKVCTLCENPRFARTGVCIGCDAGMCKTFFHVTCAQAAGFITEVHFDETDVADPFYAHCKVHSEKEMKRKRKRNYQLYRLRLQKRRQEKLALEKDDPEQMRNQRQLMKLRTKYTKQKLNSNKPWVPTQKMSRPLTSSATACSRLLAKAKIMEVDIDLLERQNAQITALNDVRKKWYIPPAFNVEFISYYIDRIERCKDFKEQINSITGQITNLTKEQEIVSKNNESQLEKNNELKRKQEKIENSINLIHEIINYLCPTKNMPQAANIGLPQFVTEISKTATPPTTTRPISVPTAAALKMGVGFPLDRHLGPPGTKVDSNRLLSTHAQNSPTTNISAASGTSVSSVVIDTSASCVLPVVQKYDCGICKRNNDQHLLAKCDTCQLYYHLGCLNPPLTRPPKKSKLYGWQCSECDKSDEEDVVPEIPKGPRKARTRFNRDGSIVMPTTAEDIKPTITNEQIKIQKELQVPPTSPPTSPSHATKASKRHSTGEIPPLKNAKVNIKRTLNKTMPTMALPNEESASIVAPPPDAVIAKGGDAKTIVNKSHAVKQPKMKAMDVGINASTANGKQTKKSPVKKNKQPKVPTGIPQPVLANLMVEQLLELPKTILPHIPLTPLIDLTKDEGIENEDPLNKNSNSNSIVVNSAEVVVNNNNNSQMTDVTKQSRKQKRKDKHRDKNKHMNNTSFEDDEKITNKEHKRKRKKKNHNFEYSITGGNDVDGGAVAGCAGTGVGSGIKNSNNLTNEIPKIKVKFRTLPAPGEKTPETRCVYVRADMVRSAEEGSRPSSVETIEDAPIPIPMPIQTPAQQQQQQQTLNDNERLTLPNVLSSTPTKVTPKTLTMVTRKKNSSPRKLFQRRQMNGFTTSSAVKLNAATPLARPNANVQEDLNCCICQTIGVATNVVTCDECHKHYHFSCLEPPVKKSPKIRGYSWHCADCDPSDIEFK